MAILAKDEELKTENIEVIGARQHNLKDINVSIRKTNS